MEKISLFFFKFIFICILFIFYKFTLIWIEDDNKKKSISKKKDENKIIKENFFVIDSNNLNEINSHMYGFCVSKKGILTNNYYKEINYNDDPEPTGLYIMIKKRGNELRISQDFTGNYGLYIYKNEITGYFAISNSFLLLEEYLIGKENISFNKDFSDNLIISELSTPSIYETMINEIHIIPPNSFIIININKKEYKIYYIDYKERSIPFESEEGLKTIDKWIDKWTYIFRSLIKKTDNISSDLSGGFDSRIVLSILLNSGLNLNKISFFSISNSSNEWYKEDFKIASNISSKLGFQLNNRNTNIIGTKMGTKDSLFCSFYSKLGITTWFRDINIFLKYPKFSFSGFGGENIRGYPFQPYKRYIKSLSMGFDNLFYNSSVRFCKRNFFLLKNKKAYYNDYEISTDFYLKGGTRHHFGKTALEEFLGNNYVIYPLIDPDIIRVKYDINPKSNYELISYIYVRLAPNLLLFPFSRNRTISDESILKAKKLNTKFGKYKIKNDYNEQFFIDRKRIFPVSSPLQSKLDNNINVKQYLQAYLKNANFINNINKVYDKNICNVAKKYKSIIGLIAVGKILKDLTFYDNK